jgi:gluconate 5-dehydrogenase
MRALACVLGPNGVTVNAVSPGMVATQGVEEFLDRDVRRRLEQRTPLGRLGLPEEVAAGALYLASPGASFVTGHELVIDGGWSAW